MASYEPGRTSAYGKDLRWRMVWQSEALGHTYGAVAHNFGVNMFTVITTLGLFLATGSIFKRSYPTEKACRKLTTPCELLILHLVVQRPGIYLHKVQRELEDVLLLTAICDLL